MTQDGYNHLVGASAAHSFIVQTLLLQLFLELPKPTRLKLAERLLDSSQQTDHFAGVAKGNEIAAMNISDTVIVMQETIDKMVGVALKLSEEAEGSRM